MKSSKANGFSSIKLPAGISPSPSGLLGIIYDINMILFYTMSNVFWRK